MQGSDRHMEGSGPSNPYGFERPKGCLERLARSITKVPPNFFLPLCFYVCLQKSNSLSQDCPSFFMGGFPEQKTPGNSPESGAGGHGLRQRGTHVNERSSNDSPGRVPRCDLATGRFRLDRPNQKQFVSSSWRQLELLYGGVPSISFWLGLGFRPGT